MANIVLKQDDQSDDTHRYHFVEDGTQQAHLQDLRHEHPDDDEHQHTHERIRRTRLAHHPVAVVEHHSHQQDVNYIFYAKIEKHLPISKI